MLHQPALPPRLARMPDAEVLDRIRELKQRLGPRLVILGHHYQQDEVIQFADFTGDSLKLSLLAAEQTDAEFIVFCGVHFMAESADILTSERQAVILPDLTAGCSMADMAHVDDAEQAWSLLCAWSDVPITPVTYVNSSAAVKRLVGRNDGACCTSSNARMVLEWALHGATPGDPPGTGHKVLFLPDQHLGRNTAYAMGWPLESMAVYDPKVPDGGLTAEAVRAARILLWKGHCSVHQLFTTGQVAALRRSGLPYSILVHPECSWEVVQQSDLCGSTEYIIRTVNQAAPGTYWAIGTEIHLVHRLAQQHPDRTVRSLAGVQCLCSTMYRIDPPHLLWTLENLSEGRIVNRITVDAETRHWSRVALDRMLALRPAQPVSAR